MQVSIHSCGKRTQTIRPVKISSLGLPLTKPEAERWREQEGRRWWRRRGWGWGGGIDQTAGFAHCSFSTFFFFPPSTLQHRETLLGGLDEGGVSVPGQAEFTYLFAGSLPDFTKDIGGRYREGRVKGLYQTYWNGSHFSPTSHWGIGEPL